MKLVFSVDKKGLTTLQDVLVNTKLKFIWIWSVQAICIILIKLKTK
jgi:hypothetical protein